LHISQFSFDLIEKDDNTIAAIEISAMLLHIIVFFLLKMLSVIFAVVEA